MKKKGFYLNSKIINIKARVAWIVVLNIKDCERYGVKCGDGLVMHLKGQTIGVYVDVTEKMVKPGEVGIFEDLSERLQITKREKIGFELLGKPKSLEALQKKLSGKELEYKEVFAIVSDIVSRKLNDVAVAFFIASSFFEKISMQELFHLIRAMVETGEKINFPGIVADKHSVGGLCGNETTPIIVPIVAGFGINIPKTSSRAITSASGTVDTFETIAPVFFELKKLKEIVRKNHGCIAWSAGNIVPSDSRIIEVGSQLLIESFPKMISSIIAKKVALGVKYLIIDIPVYPSAKIKTKKEAKSLKQLFLKTTRYFGIKTKVSINFVKGPIGAGIGPALQMRDCLMVLEQKEKRPKDLEKRAVDLAGYLLEMTGKVKPGKGKVSALNFLKSGQALKKFKEIIFAQGGDFKISSEKIKLGKIKHELKAKKSGRIKSVDNALIVDICRNLGAPFVKEAGVFLIKKPQDKIKKGETFCILYSNSFLRMKSVLKMLKKKKIFEYV